jgi:hypothetical protein
MPSSRRKNRRRLVDTARLDAPTRACSTGGRVAWSGGESASVESVLHRPQLRDERGRVGHGQIAAAGTTRLRPYVERTRWPIRGKSGILSIMEIGRSRKRGGNRQSLFKNAILEAEVR